MEHSTQSMQGLVGVFETLGIDASMRERLHQCLAQHAPQLEQELLETGRAAARNPVVSRMLAAVQVRTKNPGFTSLRVMHPYHLELSGSADTVFPLLCPVRENDWIVGWQEACNLIYSDSGFAEDACVFTTFIPEEGHAAWICSEHDTVRHRVCYIKTIENLVIIKWQMHLVDLSPGHCALFSVYIITPLCEAGNSFAAELYKRRDALMEGLKCKIDYYLAHGQAMPNPASTNTRGN